MWNLTAIRLAAMVVVAGVIVAACGGGQGGTPATVTVTTPSVTTPAEEPTSTAVDQSTGSSPEPVPSADEFAETRIPGQAARDVARAVRKSWNRCGENDVCIPGEYALSVGCKQPDPQVLKLECFVTTEKKEDGSAYGYTVDATVAPDFSRFTWGLAN